MTQIERPALRAERRLRLGRAFEAAATSASVALVLAAVTLALRKTGAVGETPTRVALALYVVVAFLVSAAAYSRKLPVRAGAVALDRYHGLSDRLSSALAFRGLDGAARTPFMEAAIEDALEAASRVDPKKAVPLKAPRDLAFAAGLFVAVVGLALFEVRTHVPPTAARTIDAVDVTADDIDAMREFLHEMEQHANTDEAKAATEEFNQLIEDLSAKRLDRTEAFRKMQSLEDKLLEGREGSSKALEEALQKIGEELKKSDMTKAAGEALDTKNLAVAEKELQELAKRLREKGSQADKAQLEKMRDALKKAGESQAKRAEALAKRRDELKADLLQKKQKQGDAGVNDEEKSLLQKKERELERLDRETKEQESAQRELDRLDRELSQAAEDLAKDLGLSAEDLERGAEDVNRMARQQMSQEEKEQLREKLHELREMLRQQGQGGQQQMVRLRKFQQAARQGLGRPGQKGQAGQGGQEQGDGQNPGDGQPGQDGKPGQDGQGQEGQGQGQKPGQGPSKGEVWVLGPNGEKMMVLTRGPGNGGGGQGQKGQGGGGDPGGKGAGTEHDDHVQGANGTSPKVGTQDTQVAGQDTGQGSSRSEVIQGAAERGFASRGYQKVYREYHTVAEEALNKDDIPGGYRFYVRRYFQLIRPREGE